MEISTATDLHGLSESKIITEHRCTTEATMRLEHKSTYLDIPELSQRPKTPVLIEHDNNNNNNNNNTTNKQTVSTNTVKTESRIGSTQTPPIVPPKPCTMNIDSPDFPAQASSSNHDTSYENKSITTTSFEFFKNIESQAINEPKTTNNTNQLLLSIPKTIETKTNDNLAEDLRNLNLIPGSPPEICYITKADSSTKTQAISEKIKKIEEHQQSYREPPQGGISILPQSTIIKSDAAIIPPPTQKVTRSPSPKPSAEGIAMSRLWTPTSHLSGYESSNNLSDVEQSHKSETEIIKEFKVMPKVPVPCNINNDLHAPTLVKEATKSVTIPIMKERNVNDNIQLIPGSPPEICFAPKPNVEIRRQSLVEAMEKTLEQNLLQGPSKVLPHSVPTLTPPSPTPISYTQKPSTIYRPPPPVITTKYNNNNNNNNNLLRNDYYESDYESDRYKYSGSESDDTSLRQKMMNEKNVINNGMELPLQQQQQQQPQQSQQQYYNQYTKTSGYAADTEDVAKNSYSYENSISTKYNQPQYVEPQPLYSYTSTNGNKKREYSCKDQMYSREEQVRSNNNNNVMNANNRCPV